MKGEETDFMGFIPISALTKRAWLPISGLGGGGQVGLIPLPGLGAPEGN